MRRRLDLSKPTSAMAGSPSQYEGSARLNVRMWHFATHSAAIKSRPFWRRTGNERTHGLSHLDALCLALDLTVSNVVHPSTVHRQHLRRNPT